MEKVLTRRTLIRSLTDKGFSRREAGKVINAIFSSIIERLIKGNCVDVPPLGMFYLARSPAPFRYFFRGTIAERYSNKYRVRFRQYFDEENNGETRRDV